MAIEYSKDPRTGQTVKTNTDSGGAMATIHAFLDPLGLGDLATMAWTETLNGKSWTQVLLDIRASAQYKAAFPGISAAVANGDISYGEGMEGQYRALVGAYKQVNQAYGLPKGFYDSNDAIAKFIENRVSPNEYKSRIEQYTSAVMGDTQTLDELGRLYGTVGHSGNPTGDLLAHYLDPAAAMPLLTEQLQSAQFASAGARAGFGAVSRQQAEQFGARAGTSAQEASQGFGALVANRELMTGLPGENAGDISQQQQLSAAFGNDTVAQQQIERRRRLRVVEGEGGGGFSATRAGLSGIGSNEV